MFFDPRLKKPDNNPVKVERDYSENKSIRNLIHKINSTSDRIVPYYDKLFSKKGYSISLKKEARDGLVYNTILINKIKRKFLFFKSEEKFLECNELNKFFTDLHTRHHLMTPFNEVELFNKNCVKAYMYAILILNNIVTDISEDSIRYRDICVDYVNLVGLLNIVNNIGKVPLTDDFNGEYLFDYLGIPSTHLKHMSSVIVKILENEKYYSPLIEIVVCDRDRTSVKGHLKLSSGDYNESNLMSFLRRNIYSQVTLTSCVS